MRNTPFIDSRQIATTRKPAKSWQPAKSRRPGMSSDSTASSITARALTIVGIILATLWQAGCERPFVDPRQPELEIVSPDFSRAFSNTKIQLEVRASAYRSVERVAVNGDSLIYDEDRQLWVHDYALHDGLNRLVFSVTDSDGQTVLDTAFAMNGSALITQNSPPLPAPRGGHSATLLNDGTVLVLGGAAAASANAMASGVAWSPGESEFRTLLGELSAARTGHTATLLPDGRVLIVGGSRREPAEEVGDMVETIEIFDPAAKSFEVVPFDGQPVRRAYHSAALRLEDDVVYIDLYGGLGDIRYRPESTFGTRRDLRRFLFRNDSLLAISPVPGPSLDYAVWGHTQTELRPFRTSGTYLVAGAYFGTFGEENVSFVLDYSSPTGIAQNPTGTFQIPRVRHASANVADGFIATFGGYYESPNRALGEIEVYSEEAGQFFAFPPANDLVRAYGLSATKLSGGRILLLGGFLSSGQGITTSAVCYLPAL